MFVKYNKKHEKPVCVKCTVIRSFILCVLMLMLLGFVLGEDAVYLRFITPELAAVVIIVGGVLLFIWKLAEYYLSKRDI